MKNKKQKKCLPDLISNERYEINLKHLIIYARNVNIWDRLNELYKSRLKGKVIGGY